MDTALPKTMTAAAIDKFGGPDVLHSQTLPLPTPKKDQVLIRVATAGIGVWDPYIREGQLDLGGGNKFPRVLGNDGAGEVVAVGKDVKDFKPGDSVYGYAFAGGFYAEYAAISADEVAPIPKGVNMEEAGVMGADGITALCGLEGTLKLSPDETVLIFGASGGIGHLAVQLAKRLGTKVIAVASGDDGVALVQKLGAHVVLEGHRKDLAQELKKRVPHGVDAALVLASGAEGALAIVKPGGRIAFPNGVDPVTSVPEGVSVQAYDGEGGPQWAKRLNELISAGPFHVEIGRRYALSDAAQAHRELTSHHLGKIAFQIRP